MRSFYFLATALGLFPVFALAHQIEGSILSPDGRPLQLEVKITCPAQAATAKTIHTDNHGGFSIFIPATGKCALSVGKATYPVYSAQNPVRYDLVYDNQTLKRR